MNEKPPSPIPFFIYSLNTVIVLFVAIRLSEHDQLAGGLTVFLSVAFLLFAVIDAFYLMRYKIGLTYREVKEAQNMTPESLLAEKLHYLSPAELSIYRDIIKTRNEAE